MDHNPPRNGETKMQWSATKPNQITPEDDQPFRYHSNDETESGRGRYYIPEGEVPVQNQRTSPSRFHISCLYEDQPLTL